MFNTACSERYTLLGKQAQPKFAPPRPGEIKHSLAAIEKARSQLGYAPGVPFGEGLERVVAFFESRAGQ